MDSIEAYAYRSNKCLAYKKEEIKLNNINIKTIGFADYHPYRIIINESSLSENTNALLNLIKQPNDVDYDIADKIYYTVRIQMEQKIIILTKNKQNDPKHHKD